MADDKWTEERTGLSRGLAAATGALIRVTRDNAIVFDGTPEVIAFCIAVENILNHGLTEKKGIFGAKKGYYGFVEGGLDKYAGAKDCFNNVKSLSSIKSFLGKGREFIRQAMQANKLKEFLQVLLKNTALVGQWYHPEAFLRKQDTADQMVELTATLHGMTFSLFVKDVDLDNSWTPITGVLESNAVLDPERHPETGELIKREAPSTPVANPPEAAAPAGGNNTPAAVVSTPKAGGDDTPMARTVSSVRSPVQIGGNDTEEVAVTSAKKKAKAKAKTGKKKLVKKAAKKRATGEGDIAPAPETAGDAGGDGDGDEAGDDDEDDVDVWGDSAPAADAAPTQPIAEPQVAAVVAAAPVVAPTVAPTTPVAAPSTPVAAATPPVPATPEATPATPEPEGKKRTKTGLFGWGGAKGDGSPAQAEAQPNDSSLQTALTEKTQECDMMRASLAELANQLHDAQGEINMLKEGTKAAATELQRRSEEATRLQDSLDQAVTAHKAELASVQSAHKEELSTVHASHESSLSSVRQELHAATADQSAAEESASKLAKLEAELAASRAQLADVNVALAAEKEAGIALRQELSEKANNHQDALDSAAAASEKARAEAVDEGRKAVRALEQEIDKLKVSLTAATTRADTLASTATQQQADHDDMLARLRSEHAAERARLEGDAAGLRSAKAQLDARLAEQGSSLGEREAQLRNSLDAAEKKLQAAEASAEETRTSLDEATTRAEAAEGSLARVATEKEAAVGELEGVKRQKDALTAMAKTLQERMKSAEQESTATKQELAALTVARDQLKTSAAAEEKVLASVRAELDAEAKAHTATREQADKVKAELSTTKANLQQLQKSAAATTADLERSRKESETVQADVARLKKELAEAQHNHRVAQEQADSSKAEIQTLQESLTEKDARRDALQTELDSYVSQHQKTLAALDSLRGDAGSATGAEGATGVDAVAQVANDLKAAKVEILKVQNSLEEEQRKAGEAKRAHEAEMDKAKRQAFEAEQAHRKKEAALVEDVRVAKEEAERARTDADAKATETAAAHGTALAAAQEATAKAQQAAHASAARWAYVCGTAAASLTAATPAKAHAAGSEDHGAALTQLQGAVSALRTHTQAWEWPADGEAGSDISLEEVAPDEHGARVAALVQALERDAAARVAQAEAVRTTLAERETASQAAAAALEASKKEVASLTQAAAEHMTAIEALTVERDEALERVQKSQGATADTERRGQEEAQKLKQELEARKKEVEKLKSQLAKLKEEHAAVITEKTAASERVTELEKDLAGVRSQLETTTQQHKKEKEVLAASHQTVMDSVADKSTRQAGELRQRVETLTTQLAEATATAQRASEDRARLEKDLEKATTELTAERASCGELRKQLREGDARHGNLARDKEAAEGKAKQLAKEVEDAKLALADAAAAADKRNENFKKVNDELLKSRELKAELSSRVSQLEKDLAAARKDADEIRNEHARLADAHENAVLVAETAKQAERGFGTELVSTKAELDKTAADKVALAEKLAKQEQESQTAINSTRAKLLTAQGEVESANATIAALRVEVETHKREFAAAAQEAEHTKRAYTDQVVDLTNQVKQLAGDNASLNENLQRTATALEAAQASHRDVVGKLKGAMDECKRIWDKEKRDQDIVLVDTKATLKQVEEKLETTSHLLEAARKRIGVLETDLETAESQVEKLRLNAEASLAVESTLRGTVAGLEGDVARHKSKVRELTESCSQLVSDNTAMQKQLAVYEEEEKRRSMWAADANATDCRTCHQPFTMLRRKHHCRNCGHIHCDDCSSGRLTMAGFKDPQRVCDDCFRVMIDKRSSSGKAVQAGGGGGAAQRRPTEARVSLDE